MPKKIPRKLQADFGVAFSKEIAEEIVAAIASNPCGIQTLLRKEEYQHFPSRKTIYEWMATKPNFGRACKEAMKTRCLPLQDLLLELSLDEYRERLSKEEISRDNLSCQNIKWLLEKLDRETFGDVNALKIMELENRIQKLMEAKEQQ